MNDNKMKEFKNINNRQEIDNITKFIKEKVKSAGKDGVVLGLSGGIDSAVVAVLAKKALGNNNITCVYMPEKSKDNDFDLQHIEKLCKRFDLTFMTHTIGKYIKIICDESLADEWMDRLTLANMKARTRMLILYMIANNEDLLVIGTSNKTELKIGYFTKHGDGAVDFEPIGHLYKTDVFRLARHLDIPNEITEKRPSAGLWKDQFDEDEIGMKYDKLDIILHGIETMERTNLRLSIKGEDLEFVKNLIKKSEHKRKLPDVPEWKAKTRMIL